MIGVLLLKLKENLICPNCSGIDFNVKREVTYLYSYKLDTPSSHTTSHNNEALPFLFDNREKVDDKEYLECQHCGNVFPCDLDELNDKIHFTILRKAIRSDHQKTPQYLG